MCLKMRRLDAHGDLDRDRRWRCPFALCSVDKRWGERACSFRPSVTATPIPIGLSPSLPPRRGFRSDFKVRGGTSRERNAIRVLGRMGFPPKIVSAALSQLEKLPKP